MQDAFWVSQLFSHTLYVWQMQRIGGRAVLVCDYCAGLHIVKTINPLSSLVFGHNSCLCHPQSQFLPLSTHVLQNYGVCGVLWSWVLFAVLGCFCEIAPACFFPGGGCMRCHGTVTGVVCVRAGVCVCVWSCVRLRNLGRIPCVFAHIECCIKPGLHGHRCARNCGCVCVCGCTSTFPYRLQTHMCVSKARNLWACFRLR